jgi:hypothetical protein
MIKDRANHQTRIIITKFADDAAYAGGRHYEQNVIDGNMLLNEGIGEMWDIICGLGSPTVYSNANAQIGVGDSSTSEAATQTDLQASTNKTWKAMESGYPQRSAQTVTFRSVFGSADANYDWNEFSVRNGATADKNMNRKVSAQGTKASGQTWTVDVAITLS